MMDIERITIGNTLELWATFFDQHDVMIVPNTVQVFLRQGTALDTAAFTQGADGVWVYALDTALYAKGLLHWSVEAALDSNRVVDGGVFNLVGNRANTN